MDLTKSNFAEKLPFVLESIQSADYIALDCEFSGLSVNSQDQIHAFDQVEERYQKLRHNCARMNAFQVGVCTFQWDPTKNNYISRPFNAYVLPDPALADRVLQFKASNIGFLVKNHFDFNKLFKEGISYRRLSER